MNGFLAGYLQKTAEDAPSNISQRAFGNPLTIGPPEPQASEMPGFHQGYVTNIPEARATYTVKPGRLFDREPYIQALIKSRLGDASTSPHFTPTVKSPFRTDGEVLRKALRGGQHFTEKSFDSVDDAWYDARKKHKRIRENMHPFVRDKLEEKSLLYRPSIHDLWLKNFIKKQWRQSLPDNDPRKTRRETLEDFDYSQVPETYKLRADIEQYNRWKSIADELWKTRTTIEEGLTLKDNPGMWKQVLRARRSQAPVAGRYTARDLEKFRESLQKSPHFPHGISLGYTHNPSESPNYNLEERSINLARPGYRYSSWPVAWHEFAHATDPLLSSRSGLSNLWKMKTQYEEELPAMIAENKAARSPYVASNMRQPVEPGLYNQQVDQYGPTFSGDVTQDQNTVANWVKALRQAPGASLPAFQGSYQPAPNPFGYSRDRRTGEQRAEALGKGFRDFMNRLARKANLPDTLPLQPPAASANNPSATPRQFPAKQGPYNAPGLPIGRQDMDTVPTHFYKGPQPVPFVNR